MIDENAIIQPVEYTPKYTKFKVYYDTDYCKEGVKEIEVEKPLTLAQMLNRERRAYLVKGIED